MEEPVGEIALDPVALHAVEQPVVQLRHLLVRALVPHGAAQFVRLPGRETGSLDRQAHALFLEERHAQGALEHRLQLGMRIGHGLEAAAPPDIRMDHVALDGARADDGDLHDDVVETARPQARQGRHLRA